MSNSPEYLSALGVYGFDDVEIVMLAALVSEDPMLLIGQSGTGKTYLLNTISEALGLEHRHYNASLISFDDLVGFPYPDGGKGAVRFLETPATVWGAQSVLIDEISRCKPEHQNRLFSLVHERRIQGVALPALRYRWAAMNPCSGDQSSMDDYAGSEPLDPALADRFALFIEAVDWQELSDEARSSIAQPGGEGRIANDSGALKARIEEWREEFLRKVDRCPVGIVRYAVAATSALNSAGVRISPRRARLVARSLLAASIAAGGMRETVCRQVLRASIPQACWGVKVSAEVIAAAHRPAWESASDKGPRWIHRFHAEPRLARKLEILLAECRSPDDGTQAIAQFIASESPERAAAFSFAIYPAAAIGKLPIGPEGVNDLGRVATTFLSTEGDISWQERLSQTVGQHPEYSRCAVVVEKLKGTRRERAQQFFNGCLVEKLVLREPATLEKEIEACVERIRSIGSPSS
jgi:MoxR-like ATPase